MQITILACPKCGEVSRLHPQDYAYSKVLGKELVITKGSRCNGCQQEFIKGAKFLFATTISQKIIEASKGINVIWESRTPVALTIKGKKLLVNNRYFHIVTDSH